MAARLGVLNSKHNRVSRRLSFLNLASARKHEAAVDDEEAIRF